MIGNVYWNGYAAIAGGGLTFLLSWRVNPLETSLWRGLLCLVILFVLMFAIRYILGIIVKVPVPDDTQEMVPQTEQGIGQNIDVTTPEEEEEEFKPIEPEKWAQVIRKMSDDEGR